MPEPFLAIGVWYERFPQIPCDAHCRHASRGEIDGIANTLQYPEAQPAFTTEFSVHGVSLMRSELNPGGAVYTELANCPLGEGA